MATETTTNNSTAGATAPAAPTQPAPEFQVPQGKRLIDEREFETYSRNQERLKGADETIRAFREAGFEKPDDAKRWSPFIKTARERNLDPDMVSRVFGETPKTKEVEDDAPRIDTKTLKSELLSEVRKEQAMERHAELEAREDEVVKSAVSEVFKDASEHDREDFTEILLGKLANPKNRERYPANHPLHNDAFVPVTDKLVRSLAEGMKKARDERKAASLVDKGDKARKPAAPGRTTAGTNAGNGAPEKKPSRPGGMPDRADVEAFVQRRIAARGG